jgi:hypothetical protein
MNAEHRRLADEIATRLRQQQAYYERILELNRQQREALDGSDQLQLVTIINRKQKYIKKIDELQSELLEYRNRWEPIRDQVDSAIKDELKVLTTKLEQTLKAVVDLEKENMQTATERKDEVSRKIAEIQQGKKVIRSYQTPGEQGGRYMDKKT